MGGEGGDGGEGYGGFTTGTICERACESLVVCDGLDARCAGSCETISAGPCGAEHQTWLMCALDEPGHLCGLGTSQYCNDEFEAYVTCAGRVVIEDDCFTDNDPGWCYCGGDFLPDVRAESVCQGNGCRCLLNDVQVGTCTSDEDRCGVDDGCCVGVFYTFDR